MEVIEKRHDGVIIFRLVGRLDANTSADFREQLLNTIKAGNNNIILDCERLDYISSAGLRIVLEGSKQVKLVEGKVVLCSLQSYIKEVFEVAKFDAFLPIATTVEEALKAF